MTLLGKAKYFSSLDIKLGYWQVAIDEKDKEKTAFTCHSGLYKFLVVPFGISNAPAIFQELMLVVLSGYSQFAAAYLDDILIFSSSIEEHFQHLQFVFNRLRQHNLRLKLKKCSFAQTETNYLGFIIGSNGIKPDNKKCEAIKSLPSPTCVREVRAFVGMCSYYWRFIPNFSKIAEPIIDLTKKYSRFKWTNEHQKAFDFIKNSLPTVPMLIYPDPNKLYTLYTDASDLCIGACLTQNDEKTQEEKPIYFLSHKLSRTQCRWSTVEKEAYAIHYSLQKLDYYLHNATFTIKTDQAPLGYLLESPMQNRKIQLCSLNIASYDCQIEYISGPTNTCADLLSRHPTNLSHALGGNLSYISDSHENEGEILDFSFKNTFQVNVLDSSKLTQKTLPVIGWKTKTR